MSYAAEVKKELTCLEVHKEHAKAELAALIKMNGMLSIMNHHFILNIQTENAAIARRIYLLLKEHYQLRAELLVRKKMKLKKNNIYIVRLKEHVEELLNDLDILENGLLVPGVPDIIMGNEQKMRSYLRGAFLASGSVNNPETSSYHLEIFSQEEIHNEELCIMLNYFNFNARTLARRNGYIVYLKEAEKITEFLILIGATNAMFKFEDVRILRDMRNSVNRLVNCETANLNKTITASGKQLENIRLIDKTIGLAALPDKLEEVALLRLEYPEASLNDLAQYVPSGAISKSGMNHRMRKINEIATQIKEEQLKEEKE